MATLERARANASRSSNSFSTVRCCACGRLSPATGAAGRIAWFGSRLTTTELRLTPLSGAPLEPGYEVALLGIAAFAHRFAATWPVTGLTDE